MIHKHINQVLSVHIRFFMLQNAHETYIMGAGVRRRV